MAVYQRGNRFQANFMLAGKRLRETFNTEPEAKAWEAACRAAHALGKPLPSAQVGAAQNDNRVATIGELVRYVDRRHWSGDKTKRAGAKLAHNAYLFADWCGRNMGVEEALDEDRIEDYFRWREEEHRNSGSTINRHRAALSKLASVAVRLGRLSRKPEMTKRPEGQARERIYTEAEEKLILATVEAWGYPDYRDLFIFLADTGMRLGETGKLPWVALFPKRVIVIPGNITKSGKERTIVMTPRAEAAINRLRAKYGSTSGPFSWVDERSLRTLWDRLRGHLEWMDDSTVVHTFRHTFASRFVQETGDLYALQRWLGHSSPVVTQRYAKYAPKNLEQFAAILARRQERVESESEAA